MAWTNPTTRVVSEFITAPIWNTDLVDNLTYLKGEVDDNTTDIGTLNTEMDTVSQSVVTGSRALDTIYQNTSGKIMFVSVTVQIQVTDTDTDVNGNSYVDVYCENATPPTIRVSELYLAITFNGLTNQGNVTVLSPVTFIVPSGYYYKLTKGKSADGSDATILVWTEWTLH